MTASVSQHTIPVKDASAVRKRRRRAPAGGAADDCFTCSKRNVKCDRRRPYCSQCLEIGNECSGYKTQLTWGVGVASRGKLRGLSLPVVKAPPVTREPKKTPASRPRTSSSNSSRSSHSAVTPPWPEHAEPQPLTRGPIDIPAMASHHHHAASHPSAPTTPYGAVQGYDYLSMQHHEHSPALHQNAWASMPYSNGIMHSPHAAMPKFNHAKYNPVPIMTDSLSSSIESLNSEVDYASPISQSFPREEMPYIHPSPPILYDGYSTHTHSSPMPPSPPSAIIIDHSRAPLPCHALIYAPSEPSSSLNSHVDHFESHFGHKMMRESEHLRLPEVDTYSTSCSSTGTAWLSPRAKHYDPIKSPQSEQAPSQWPSATEPASISMSQDLLAKMPFFMDYYKMTMCPSMVFIDGPENPFRDHIMQLAADSQSLRHAICALAACNLRMKRKLSLGQDAGEVFQKLKREQHAMESMDAQPEDQSLTEEYQHRNLAIHLLNQQLNDSTKSTHDSVLATILLLCHYRMMESGIAKFHTQFAGVNKILSLRSQKTGEAGDSSSWMEAIFTYFDAITASINDREAQLTPDNAPLLPLGAENLVGCDRELFKTISKLGRLNLLSQHRPVQNTASAAGTETPRSQSPLGSPLGHITKSIADTMHNPPSHRFDGNGFGSTLDDDEMMASAMSSSLAYDDQRTMFWGEWREARMALQNWQFDSSAVAASLPAYASPAQIRDLGSLSEAFRYAALLYMERLANPNFPSSHSNLQNLVSQVVYYATSLENGSGAEKFLLWPLFVAGSECVNELQQNIVRTKCRDIMSRSGYMNNLAALDVLEKLWAGEFGDRDARSPGVRPSGWGAPLNWTRCIGGPGVGVEWIMF